MCARQPLPLLWLLSDARNDSGLESALAELPRGSGFVFRHYHLAPDDRRKRFAVLARVASAAGHLSVLADRPSVAREWGAQGVYGAVETIRDTTGMVSLATAHDGGELRAAAGADGVFLSPVFATRSHPDARPLGIHGFHVLAQQSAVPVIALGGMTRARAHELDWPRWAAIDGLASTNSA